MWLLFAIHVVLFGVLLVLVAMAQSRPISDLLTFDMHPYTGFFGFLSKTQLFSVRPPLQIPSSCNSCPPTRFHVLREEMHQWHPAHETALCVAALLTGLPHGHRWLSLRRLPLRRCNQVPQLCGCVRRDALRVFRRRLQRSPPQRGKLAKPHRLGRLHHLHCRSRRVIAGDHKKDITTVVKPHHE